MILLICASAFFSATETAFSSLNKIRLRNYAGDKRAALTLKIANDFDTAISTILIGNNVVNIASASIGTILFTRWLGDSGVGISTIVMTVVVLIFGEVLPKSVAKENPEKFALAVAGIINVLMTVFYPLTWVLKKIKLIFTSKSASKDNPTVTEEELKFILEEIEGEGVLEQHETELVQSALDFNDITVSEILTPRVDIVAVDITESAEVIKNIIFNEGYSRIPVYDKTIDNIIGVLNEKDFIKAYLHNKNVNLRSLIQKTIYVPPKKLIGELLKEIQHQKMHLAVVTDQYGGTLGIISLEDIIEELVGEIWDECDDVVTPIIELSEGEYQVSADLNVYDLFDHLEVEGLEYDGQSETISAWALDSFKKIPEKGDSFIYQSLKLTVLDIVDQRITNMLVNVVSGGTTAA